MLRSSQRCQYESCSTFHNLPLAKISYFSEASSYFLGFISFVALLENLILKFEITFPFLVGPDPHPIRFLARPNPQASMRVAAAWARDAIVAHPCRGISPPNPSHALPLDAARRCNSCPPRDKELWSSCIERLPTPLAAGPPLQHAVALLSCFRAAAACSASPLQPPASAT
jgi:hypothetical protein